MSNHWYFHPYYIMNYLLCFMYPLIRYYKLSSDGLNFKDSWGFKRESQLITGLTTLILLRFARYFTNYKKFVNETIFFIKAGTAMILFLIDVRISCWYLFACFVVWLLFKIPRYNGQSKIIHIQSEDHFKNLVTKKNNNKNNDQYWFTIFFSTYSYDCIFTEELWAKLSWKYSCNNLNFAIVDVDIVPGIAREHNVPVTGFFIQLPMIIMFKNGVEEGRYPAFQKKGVPYQVRCYKEKDIVNLFDLEKIFAETLSRNLKSGRVLK